jgi:transposase
MTKPLSTDLRQRVLAAIHSGMSCRAAAERFGIAPSAAVKWRRLWLETGSVAPREQGGDKRSGRIEALGSAILAMVEETPDITLVEIAERLAREHGERFAPSTVHRFFRRHGWSFKKSLATPASRIARTSLRRARPGLRSSPIWTRSG